MDEGANAAYTSCFGGGCCSDGCPLAKSAKAESRPALRFGPPAMFLGIRRDRVRQRLRVRVHRSIQIGKHLLLFRC